VNRTEPLYPPVAKAARIQGAVIFQAIIGADGQIRNLHLQEGHPLLVAAARTAILQWRYRPTLLNGKPVEVVTTITVRFSLSQ
jgi:protein TonB